jgi:hypothetical protein
MNPSLSRNLKRRAGMLYRLRRKGVRCDTRKRTIYYPYGYDPLEIRQARILKNKFGFTVQFEII